MILRKNRNKLTSSLGCYVRVFGKLRLFKEKFSVQSYDISRIYNFNAVTFHHLKVVKYFCHYNLQNSKAKKKLELGDEMDVVDDLEDSELSSLEQRILDIIKKTKESYGPSLEKLENLLSDNFSNESISQAVVDLYDKGKIISEKDNHFCLNL
jgi:hypothetical protein